MKNPQRKVAASRRGFLKKVAYTAPAIVAIGTLTLPASASASYILAKTVTVTNGNGGSKVVEVFKENDGSGDVMKIITKTKKNGDTVTKTKYISSNP